MPNVASLNTRLSIGCSVRALFNFVGKNNDELCFKKNDLIQISQKTDEGWWEGTFNGKTGWFPSNYVVELSASESDDKKTVENGHVLNSNASATNVPSEDNIALYKKIIFENLIDSERIHVEELKTLLVNYLMPMRMRKIISEEELSCIFCNLDKICHAQSELQKSLENVSKQIPKRQNIGGIFLKMAPTFKDLLKTYCFNHPNVVEIFVKHKDVLSKYMESLNEDLMTLITGLSSPFRRFERYPNFLQELERNTEETHPDRGDTQRAVTVYRDLVDFYQDLRKQRETQLELLSSTITDWQGPPLASLGNILHSKPASIRFGDVDQWDDLFVIVFPSLILFLEVSHQMNSYVYKKKLGLKNLRIKRGYIDDNLVKHGEEFSSDSLKKCQKTVISFFPSNSSNQTSLPSDVLSIKFTSFEETVKVLQIFSKIEGLILDNDCFKEILDFSPEKYSTIKKSESKRKISNSQKNQSVSSTPNHASVVTQKADYHQISDKSQNRLVFDTSCNLSNSHLNNSNLNNSSYSTKSTKIPTTVTTTTTTATATTNNNNNNNINNTKRRSSSHCLRPLPCLIVPPEIRAGLMPCNGSSNFDGSFQNARRTSTSDFKVKLRKKDSATHVDQDETRIMNIVESYFTNSVPLSSVKDRCLRKTSQSPQMLVAEEEKILVEEWIGDELVIQEKTLVDTVYNLKDEMNQVRQDIKKLTDLILDEQNARKKSDELIRRLLINHRKSATPQLSADKGASSTESVKTTELGSEN